MQAVHLELSTDMKTESFIGAFRRFVARRGSYKEIFTDDGKQFTAASRIIHVLTADSVAMNFISNAGITWHFSANLAPWWGGFWERMVRTMKELSRKTIVLRSLTYDQLATVRADIEQVINEDRYFMFRATSIRRM